MAVNFIPKLFQNPANKFSWILCVCVCVSPYGYGTIFVKKNLKTYFIIINSNIIMQMA